MKSSSGTQVWVIEKGEGWLCVLWCLLKAKVGSQREQGELYHVPDAPISALQFAKGLVHGSPWGLNRLERTAASGTMWFLVDLMWSHIELDLIIFVGPFQLRILCDSIVCMQPATSTVSYVMILDKMSTLVSDSLSWPPNIFSHWNPVRRWLLVCTEQWRQSAFLSCRWRNGP